MIAWLGLVARLVVGGVLVVAGAVKFDDPAGAVRAVRAYEILPEAIVPLVGYGLPVLEVLTGACLILGLLSRLSGLIGVVLFTALIIGIASVWARGIEIDCGCFGGGGYEEGAASKYPWEIARDVGLLIGSALVAWLPRTPYALDNHLFRSSTIERNHEDVLEESAVTR